MPSEGTSAFDALTSSYDAWYETPLGRFVEAAFALVETKPGAIALGLSCGTGDYALGLAQQGFRVVGIDLNRTTNPGGRPGVATNQAVFVPMPDGRRTLSFRKPGGEIGSRCSHSLRSPQARFGPGYLKLMPASS